MTKTNSESGKLDGEATERPNPNLEANAGDEQTSQEQSGVDINTLHTSVKELTSIVRSLQSGKDRGVSEAKKTAQKTQEDVENLRGQIEKIMSLRDEGLDADDIEAALSRVSVEDRLERMESLILELRGNGMSSDPTAEQRAVISESGLEENDPAVTRAIAQGLRGAELKAELLSEALKRANKPSPGASDAEPMASGSVEADEYDISNIEDSDELYKIASKVEFKKRR